MSDETDCFIKNLEELQRWPKKRDVMPWYRDYVFSRAPKKRMMMINGKQIRCDFPYRPEGVPEIQIVKEL